MNNFSGLNAMEHIDSSMIDEAEAYKGTKKGGTWVKWAATAACLCLILIGAVTAQSGNQANTVQNWRTGYSANSYFKFCNSDVAEDSSDMDSIADCAIPYDQSRNFSDRRSELEANGVIPMIASHPQFTFVTRYNKDGSVYCVELLWCRRSADGLKEYSDLKVVAGHEEVPFINDCICIELDKDGHVIEPAVTVTERDGIQIVARGRDDAEKSLTFQTENGWYQISGSWNDSYDAVVDLMDWFWDYPIDFAQFPMEAGDNYTGATLSEFPDAFKEYLPNFAEFGFVEEAAYVSLKNGNPVHFEGNYVAHADAEKVKNQEYNDGEGITRMHWCILAEPDVYDLEGNLGDINSLTREQVDRILENEDNKVKFIQDDLLVIVYPDSPDEAWPLIASLQD